MKYAYTFDDVTLVPQYNNIPSRTIPVLDSWLTKKTKINIPIIASNMDTVIGDDMADAIIENGSIPIFHRFTDEKKQFEWAKKYGDKCFLSCGLNNLDLTVKLLKETDVKGVCIDIAHAHSATMKNFMEELRKKVGNEKEIIGGNICTPIACHDLVTWGMDAIKCGIGPGCFRGDVKLLLSNGKYKRIENINVGDMVINMHGKSVKVLNKMNMGVREVIKIKSKIHFSDTYVTPDHRFLMDDGKWIEINNYDNNNNNLLVPSEIDWDLPKTKTINLNNFSDLNKELDYDYNLGYVLGLYITGISFMNNEETLQIVKELMNENIEVYISALDKCFSSIVDNFKHNSEFYCSNSNYMKGLCNGMDAGNFKNVLYDDKMTDLYEWARLANTGGNFKKPKLYNKSGIVGSCTVWDIEVDCPTHSFIANNVIVHNSACTTRMVTGFGVSQFSAIRECSEVAKKLQVPLIADGGIRSSRDVVLALAAGASTVMIGGLLSNTYESAAPKEEINGVLYSKYRGQASSDFQEDFYGSLKKGTVAEGIAFKKVCNKSASDVFNNLCGGLRSGLTYGGAKNIKELQRKAEFRLTTGNFMYESKPRPT